MSGHGTHLTTERPWTDEEKERLRNDWGRGAVTRHALAMGRSEASVRYMANYLGLRAAKGIGPRREWTPEEDEKLRRWVGKVEPPIIATRLNRSPLSIPIRAYHLGLQWLGRDGWYSAAEVARMLGVRSSSVTNWIASGKLKARRRDTYREGRTPMLWEVLETDLREFIVTYPGEISQHKCDLMGLIQLLQTPTRQQLAQAKVQVAKEMAGGR